MALEAGDQTSKDQQAQVIVRGDRDPPGRRGGIEDGRRDETSGIVQQPSHWTCQHFTAWRQFQSELAADYQAITQHRAQSSQRAAGGRLAQAQAEARLGDTSLPNERFEQF